MYVHSCFESGGQEKQDAFCRTRGGGAAFGGGGGAFDAPMSSFQCCGCGSDAGEMPSAGGSEPSGPSTTSKSLRAPDDIHSALGIGIAPSLP